MCDPTPPPLRWYDKALIFLARPLGGFELEAFIVLFGELWFATVLAVADKGAWYTLALRPLYAWVPGPVLAAPWFLAAGLTIAGFILFLRKDPLCVYLRIAGATISMLLWFVIAANTLYFSGGEQGYAGLFVGACIAQFRFIIGAGSRHAVYWVRK